MTFLRRFIHIIKTRVACMLRAFLGLPPRYIQGQTTSETGARVPLQPPKHAHEWRSKGVEEDL